MISPSPLGLGPPPEHSQQLQMCLNGSCCTEVSHGASDFLTSGEAECSDNLRIIITICKWLRLPLKERKIEGPSPVLPFLGIILDKLKREIRLPTEKLDHQKLLISAWKTRKGCRKRELLSLVGKREKGVRGL